MIRGAQKLVDAPIERQRTEAVIPMLHRTSQHPRKLGISGNVFEFRVLRLTRDSEKAAVVEPLRRIDPPCAIADGNELPIIGRPSHMKVISTASEAQRRFITPDDGCDTTGLSSRQARFTRYGSRFLSG